MGAEAVMALVEADENSIPCVVSLDGNQVKFSCDFNVRSIFSIFCSFFTGHSCTVDEVRGTYSSRCQSNGREEIRIGR